jgi:hypothetical protein
MDLSLHIAEVSDILSTHTSLNVSTVTQLLDLESRMQHAQAALPLDLAHRNTSIADLNTAAYAYHLQFYSTNIVIHRAVIRFLVSEGSPSSEDGQWRVGNFQYSPEFSWSAIYESAIFITELSVTYCEIFGSDRILTIMLHNIYMAAIALINHALMLQHNRCPIDKDTRGIQLLVGILMQTQEQFPIAGRMYQALSQALCGTSLSFLLDNPALAIRQPGSVYQICAACPPTPWGRIGVFTNHPIPVSPTEAGGVFDSQNQVSVS